MTQELPMQSEEDRRAAYQRGKFLTALVVILTAAGFVVPAVVKLFTDPSTQNWQDWIIGPVLLGLITWFALRGEGISTGCLTAIYSLILSGVVLTVGVVALVYFAPQAFTASDGSHPELGPLNWHNAPGFWQIAAALAGPVWAGFAFWVLVLSKDARFYRDARRRGIQSATDPAFAQSAPPPLPARKLPLFREPVQAVAFQPVDPEAFRRGKFLTITVVVVTAVLCLSTEVRNVWFGYPAGKVVGPGQNPWADLVFSAILIGLVCGYAWRGGKTSTGCLTIFYSLGVGMFALASLFVLLAFTLGSTEGGIYKDYGITIKGIGHDLGPTFTFFALGAWTVFSFWVLVRSPDARAYRQARQFGLAAAAAKASGEWEQRRP